MSVSSAYVTCTFGGQVYTWHFTGVLSVEHSLTLNLEKDSAEGADIVNGARNQPDQVVLSVMETDAAHSPGWSARMLEAMNGLKRRRVLCRVVTSLSTYRDMLLTEISARQDEENQCGWSGTLVFTEFVPAAEADVSGAKTSNNSSTRLHTGTGSVRALSGEQVEQALERAGVK